MDKNKIYDLINSFNINRNCNTELNVYFDVDSRSFLNVLYDIYADDSCRNVQTVIVLTDFITKISVNQNMFFNNFCNIVNDRILGNNARIDGLDIDLFANFFVKYLQFEEGNGCNMLNDIVDMFNNYNNTGDYFKENIIKLFGEIAKIYQNSSSFIPNIRVMQLIFSPIINCIVNIQSGESIEVIQTAADILQKIHKIFSFTLQDTFNYQLLIDALLYIITDFFEQENKLSTTPEFLKIVTIILLRFIDSYYTITNNLYEIYNCHIKKSWHYFTNNPHYDENQVQKIYLYKLLKKITINEINYNTNNFIRDNTDFLLYIIKIDINNYYEIFENYISAFTTTLLNSIPSLIPVYKNIIDFSTSSNFEINLKLITNAITNLDSEFIIYFIINYKNEINNILNNSDDEFIITLLFNFFDDLTKYKIDIVNNEEIFDNTLINNLIILLKKYNINVFGACVTNIKLNNMIEPNNLFNNIDINKLQNNILSSSIITYAVQLIDIILSKLQEHDYKEALNLYDKNINFLEVIIYWINDYQILYKYLLVIEALTNNLKKMIINNSLLKEVLYKLFSLIINNLLLKNYNLKESIVTSFNIKIENLIYNYFEIIKHQKQDLEVVDYDIIISILNYNKDLNLEYIDLIIRITFDLLRKPNNNNDIIISGVNLFKELTVSERYSNIFDMKLFMSILFNRDLYSTYLDRAKCIVLECLYYIIEYNCSVAFPYLNILFDVIINEFKNVKIKNKSDEGKLMINSLMDLVTVINNKYYVVIIENQSALEIFNNYLIELQGIYINFVNFWYYIDTIFFIKIARVIIDLFMINNSMSRQLIKDQLINAIIINLSKFDYNKEYIDDLILLENIYNRFYLNN